MEPINMITLELTRLLDEYYNCQNQKVKEMIYRDIMLLSKAYLSWDDNVKGTHKKTVGKFA